MTRFIALLAVLAACGKPSPRYNEPVTVAPPPVVVADAAAEPTSVVSARALVASLVAGNYDEVVATFDATMSAALPEPKVKATWQGLTAQVGAFVRVERARTEDAPGHPIAILTCTFERAELDARVVYDDAGKVAGLQFTPATSPYRDPPYVDRSTFDERDVTIGSGEWALPGTLSLPKAKAPVRAVVLVHGSGPSDRDETLGANKVFKDLAGGLASRGIAVLRYDKRTKVHGAKMAQNPDLTLEQETVEDALLAVELLRGMKEIDAAHVVVAGHSLGGFAAPRIAVRSPHVAAIAILAGNTSNDVPAAMISQMEYIARVDPSQAAAMPAMIEKIKAAQKRIAELQHGAKPAPGEVVLGAGAAYWIDLAKYDAIATVKNVKQPIFVAQGGRDYQVTQTDFDAWKKALAARKDVAFHLYPELNHALGAGTGPGSPAEYQKRTPVDARLVDDLAAWINGS